MIKPMAENNTTGTSMDLKKQLASMLQEAEIYSTQGLVAEARAKYQDAYAIVQNLTNLKNKESLLKAIESKFQAISDTKEKIEKGPSSTELSEKAQDLIKNLFSFSENKDADNAALDGAVALAKFGQFDRSLNELKPLLHKEGIRVEAAKNILRCHMATSSSEEAISQYHQWCSEDLFKPNQLETVRVYLEDILQKKGIDANLPSPLPAEDAASTFQLPETEPDFEADEAPDSDEEFLDITSIGITFNDGPHKGNMVEFDVNFQSGNMLSLIISKKDQSLIEGLTAGMKLEDIQFFSPIAIFNGSGVVSSKTHIRSGPKQGDFCLDIRIVST
jgi:tetratricopeptide (TPR) repeat protein